MGIGELAAKGDRLTEVILDNAGMLLVVVDAEGRIQRFNQAAQELSGYSLEEVKGKFPWDILLPPEAAKNLKIEVFEDLANNPAIKHRRYVNEWLCKNGSRRLTEWSNTLLLDEEGKTKFVVGIGTDITERALAEKALLESEERFRVLFENAPEAIIVLNTDTGKFVDANQNSCTLFAMSYAELLKAGPADVSPPVQPDGRDSAETAYHYIQKTLAGETQHFEWVHCDSQGRHIPCEVYLVPLPSGSNNLLRGSIVDISARKRAELALRASEENYRLLFENMTNGFTLLEMLFDEQHQPVDGRFLEINPAFTKLTGLTGEMIIGKTIKEVLPGVEDYWIETYGKVALTKEAIAFENYSRNIGKHFELWSFSPKQNQVAVIFSDITERKQAEERQVDLARILEQSLNELYVVDQETLLFIEANRAARDNLGYTMEELSSMTPLDIKPEVSKSVFSELIESLQTGENEKIVVETFHQRKDGSRYSVESHLQSGTYASRPALIAIALDTSVRKQAEQERLDLERQIQHAQKLESLGILAGGIAHDFNNLLTTILGYSDLALNTLPKDSSASRHIGEVTKGARRAADLAQQMLAYSGKGRFVVQPLDISELVQDMIRLLEISISKKCTLKYHLQKDLPAFEADAGQVRQIIMNLIINASDAIGEQNGVIAVSTGTMYCDTVYLSDSHINENLPEGYYVYLEVTDTGCGMTEESKKRIFDPFYTTKFTGRGLGLAAVLGIVRGHKAAVKVYSEIDKGSSFKILFPASEQSAVSTIDTEIKSDEWHTQGMVLIVDDEDSVRSVAAEMLENMGFEVLTARDGLEGVDIFRREHEKIRFVLLDMAMPRLNGEETFREMRRIKRDVKTILSSGYNEQSATDRFAGKGLAGFIQKPYRYAELVATIRKVLGVSAHSPAHKKSF